MKKRLAVCAVLLMLSTGAPAQKTGRKLIDLTYSFSAESIYWPTAEDFRLKTDSEGINEKGYYYSAFSFAAAEHGGTHMDAPVHFAKGMPTIDQIPLDRLIAPGVLVDVRERAGGNADYEVAVQDLTAWEGRNGRIPDGCVLLLRTGWGRFYHDRKKYLGTDRKGAAAVAELHFPGLSPAAAERELH